MREHHAAVYRSALRVLEDPQAAEDVAQQVFLALIEGRLDLAQSRDEAAVLRWWAVRTALSARRGESNRRTREEQHVMRQAHEDPAEEAARQDDRSTLERLVAALPEDLRLAVRLRFEEGLSYARVGEALAVSEPVAHERVQRALARLRKRLHGVGLAALAADLEPRLAEITPAPVPAGLAERLITTPVAAAAAAGWTLAVGGGCVAAALALGAWLVLRPATRADAETVAQAAPRTPPAAPESLQAADSSSRSALPPPGRSVPAPDASAGVTQEVEPAWIRGRVVDADGGALQGAPVTAASVVRSGKFPAHVAQARTRVDGSFELEVPALAADGTSWWISTHRAGLSARSDEPIRTTPGALVAVAELVLGGVTDARPGPWTLALRTIDPAGAALDGVVVRVLTSATRRDGTPSAGAVEAHGVTDATGWVELNGEGLSRKRVTLDARSRGWRQATLELALSGAHTELVTLEPGLEIRGRLVDAAGRAVEPREDGWGSDPQVFASARDVNAWFDALHEPGGRFRVIGLAEEPHRVFLQSPTLSPICLEGVVPGGEELEIVVKRRDEPLDVGPHCAEVHGVLRDARTGAPVAAGWDDVEAEWLPGDGSLDFERDLRPNVLWPRPRQTAAFGEPPQPRADFHLVGLRPGRYAVAARVRGWAPALSAPLALETHTLVAGLELGLAPQARVSGAVQDLDGAPQAGAWVLLTGDGPHSQDIVTQLDRDVRETDGEPAAWSRNLVRCDERGRFTFEGLPPDLGFTLVALHPRRAPLRVTGLSPGAEPLVLRFAGERTR